LDLQLFGELPTFDEILELPDASPDLEQLRIGLLKPVLSVFTPRAIPTVLKRLTRTDLIETPHAVISTIF
ncbi:hypothetical protein FRB98_007387, partial [Tulasnella sp. 332]